MKKAICFLSVFLFLVSCSVKKRSYRNGYYVDWAFKHRKNETGKKTVVQGESTINLSQKEIQNKHTHPVEQETVISASALDKPIIKPVKEKPVLHGDDCGDVLQFKDGKTLKVKVTEVNGDNLKYKRCDNIEGPVFVVRKSDLSGVTYLNGVKEKFETPVEDTPSSSSGPGYYNGPKMQHPNVKKGIIFLILTLFIGFIGPLVALILANRGLNDIMLFPGRFSGKEDLEDIKTISTVILVVSAVLALLLIAVVAVLLAGI